MHVIHSAAYQIGIPCRLRGARAMQSWLSEIVASKFADGLGASALNLKEEFKLTNLKAPFCAAMEEALKSEPHFARLSRGGYFGLFW